MSIGGSVGREKSGRGILDLLLPWLVPCLQVCNSNQRQTFDWLSGTAFATGVAGACAQVLHRTDPESRTNPLISHRLWCATHMTPAREARFLVSCLHATSAGFRIKI